MPRLLDLTGAPMTWETLHARNALYWAWREEQERFDPVQFTWHYYRDADGHIVTNRLVRAE